MINKNTPTPIAVEPVFLAKFRSSDIKKLGPKNVMVRYHFSPVLQEAESRIVSGYLLGEFSKAGIKPDAMHPIDNDREYDITTIKYEFPNSDKTALISLSETLDKIYGHGITGELVPTHALRTNAQPASQTQKPSGVQPR